ARRVTAGAASLHPNGSQPMMSVAAFCLAYAGFAALCLGMDRHYETVFERALPRLHRTTLRAAGWAALALSLWATAAVWGWRYGRLRRKDALHCGILRNHCSRSMSTRVLTGITTSGTPHLGNYAGAIRPAIAASQQPGIDAFYFMADYHALIKCDDPARVARS